MNLSESSILMAMTSRIKDGKRQGLTISSKLMADYLEKRVKKLKVVDQGLRKGWKHYPGMLYDFYKTFIALRKPWDLFVAFDVVNGVAGTMANVKLCYAVDDQSRPHGKFVSWLYRRLDECARSNSDIILESSPNPSKTNILMPSLCPPLRVEHFILKGNHVLGYLGALEEGFGVDRAISAMPKILAEVPDASMEIVGDGPERAKLEGIAKDLPVRFYGFLPDEEAVDVVKKWRVGLAPYTEAMREIDSGKVRFYAWSGLPSVVSTETPQMVKLVTSFGAGLASAFDPKVVVKPIARLLLDDALWAECQLGCKRLAESLECNAYFERLFSEI